jgi:hypothetical protein
MMQLDDGQADAAALASRLGCRRIAANRPTANISGNPSPVGGALRPIMPGRKRNPVAIAPNSLPGSHFDHQDRADQRTA